MCSRHGQIRLASHTAGLWSRSPLLAFAAPAAGAIQTADRERPRRPARNTTSKPAPTYWFPTADIVISSEQLGIPGSQIDAKRDLGLTDTAFPVAQRRAAAGAQPQVPASTTCRSTTTQTTTLKQDIVFNGIRYRARPAGELDARLEDLRVRLRVRLRRQELGIRRLRSAGQVHRRAGLAAPARSPASSRARAARFRRIGGIGALLRRAEHRRSPASSAPSRSRTASTAATTRTTSTSTSTAR